MQSKCFIVGVDFDDTICHSEWPGIGKFKFGAIPVIRWMTRRYCVILWTCREDEKLKQAVRRCNQAGIYFDYINTNSWERIGMYGGDCRKLSCDMLIDDKAAFVFWPWIFVKLFFKEGKEWINSLFGS